MDRAAKLARIGDRLISFIAMILVLCMMLYGGYSLLDNWRLSQAGFGSDLMKYKPAPGQSWSMAELVAMNKDVIGWITIDDTHIDQPIVQGKDDMEYVNKDPLGDFSLSGSIFLSCLNSQDFSDPYSLMYGHHMENGGMFGDLTKFLKKDYFDDHKTGTLYSLDSQWDIEVFAVLKTDAADPDVYSIPQGASTLDGRFLERLKKDCQQYCDIGVKPDQQIIALSTCYDVETNGRVLLFGRIQNKQEVKNANENSYEQN